MAAEQAGAAGSAHPLMVVIGASAGGVEALRSLVSRLPEGLEASLFVVLHLPEEGTSMLPAILNRVGTLPAAHAADAEHIRSGRVYVAPPGRHLLVSPTRVHLSAGPRENGHRPAIDPLFRSAASVFGKGVVAILLSGTLDDGTAGFHSVKRAGGTTMVEDPEEASYRGMIDSALQGAPVDAVLGTTALAAQIELLTNGRMSSPQPPGLREDTRTMATTAGNTKTSGTSKESADSTYPDAEPSPDDARNATPSDPPGAPSGLTCPECNVVLWDVGEGNLVRFRCRVGHAYNGQTLASEQSKAVEAALWTAARMLEERAVLLGTLAGRMQQRNHRISAQRFSSRADEAIAHADAIRSILVHDAPTDVPGVPGSLPTDNDVEGGEPGEEAGGG